jgi:protein-disulfide isomerase
VTKNKLRHKIFFFTKATLILLLLCFKVHSDDSVVLGNKEATVKIKIFSSLTCPHCADFHKNVVPKIKKNYVDLGKVQLIFIDFPLDLAALNASKILNCIERKKQIDLLNIIYEKQNEWTSASNIEEINENLEKLVVKLGINYLNFDNCLNNEDIENKILSDRIEAQKKYSINSTPTIIINEKKFEGEANFKSIKKIIEKLI